jgi:hypothetical protein
VDDRKSDFGAEILEVFLTMVLASRWGLGASTGIIFREETPAACGVTIAFLLK